MLNPMTMEARPRAPGSWLREPLLHCTLLGVLIFGAHYAWARPEAPDSIVVSARTQAELDALFEQRMERAPTPDEHAELVSRHVEDELLFREGLARRLVEHDPALRDQLIARTRLLIQGSAAGTPPSESELRAYYQAHLVDFIIPASVSFTEYFVPAGPQAEQTAQALEHALLRHETPVDMPMIHRQRSEAELAKIYGADLAARVFRLRPAHWQAVRSARGFHVVHLDARLSPVQRKFEDVQKQVADGLERSRAQAELERELSALRQRFSVQVEGSTL